MKPHRSWKLYSRLTLDSRSERQKYAWKSGNRKGNNTNRITKWKLKHNVQYSQEDKLYIAKAVLKDLEPILRTRGKTYRGTKEFKPFMFNIRT